MTQLTYFTPRTSACATVAPHVALTASYVPATVLRRVVRPLLALTRSTPRPRTRPLIRAASRAIDLLVADGVAIRVTRQTPAQRS